MTGLLHSVATVGDVERDATVLVVDPSSREGVVRLVEGGGFAVTRSATPEAALFELGQRDFSAVVALLPLPGFGIEGLIAGVRLRNRIPVMVLTTEPIVDWVEALRAGADDHLRVPCDVRELRARLVALIRRARGPLSPRRKVRIGELVVRLGHGVVAIEPVLALTPVQRTLLGYVAGQPGVVLSETALADGVRRVHGPTSDVQLEAELRGLQAAIEVASGVPNAIEHVQGTGWRLAAAEHRTADSQSPSGHGCE